MLTGTSKVEGMGDGVVAINGESHEDVVGGVEDHSLKRNKWNDSRFKIVGYLLVRHRNAIQCILVADSLFRFQKSFGIYRESLSLLRE